MQHHLMNTRLRQVSNTNQHGTQPALTASRKTKVLVENSLNSLAFQVGKKSPRKGKGLIQGLAMM
jgi:hypothetical protein